MRDVEKKSTKNALGNQGTVQNDVKLELAETRQITEPHGIETETVTSNDILSKLKKLTGARKQSKNTWILLTKKHEKSN